MKFYLSSYEIGDKIQELKALIPKGKIGYISNALDYSNADLEKQQRRIDNDMQSLRDLDITCEYIDLREYFGNQEKLELKLEELGAIFISGGNVFILRQAMKLSGLDIILENFEKNNEFLYAGYSAAGAVLYKNLKAYEIVDNATETPYQEQDDTIWEGLGLIDYAFLPHWDSDHPESADIDKEIEFCKANNIPYRAIRDGDVIIIDSILKKNVALK